MAMYRPSDGPRLVDDHEGLKKCGDAFRFGAFETGGRFAVVTGPAAEFVGDARSGHEGG